MLTFRKTNIVFGVVSASLLCLLFFFSFHWIYVFTVVVLIYLSIVIYGSFTISSNFHFQVICSGKKDVEGIALTFDDGPVPGVTDKVLDILKKHDLKAAFFCIGQRIYENPDLAKRIVDEGHIIGNHTYGHSHFFDFFTTKDMLYDIELCSKTIYEYTRKEAVYFRPPYGVTNPNMKKALEKLSLIPIGWSVRSLDTITKDINTIFKRITKDVKEGDIILLHDGDEKIVFVLEMFIEEMRKRNISIKPLNDII